MAHFISFECTSCGACLEECPTNSILAAKPKYLIDAETCTDCRCCVAVCPVLAIREIQDESKNPKKSKK